MFAILRKISPFVLAVICVALTSCMGKDEAERYAEWRKENIKYVNDMQALTENGQLVYTTVRPGWAPGNFVLMRWHNDRSLTENNLVPLYNSTCNVTYRLSTIEEAVDSSYNMTQYGDSIYRCKPSSTIPGFAIALTNMHIGDSCTVIIPYFCAYDDVATTSITKPYSTLIYQLKLVSIPAYEIPM